MHGRSSSAARAADRASRTEYVTVPMHLWLGHAELLAAAGRDDEAREALAETLRLAALKGSTAYEDRARALLDRSRNHSRRHRMTETIDAPAAVKPINHWIAGAPYAGASGRSGPVYNPATGQQSGAVDFATRRRGRPRGPGREGGVPGVARALAREARRDPLRDPRARRTSGARRSRRS